MDEQDTFDRLKYYVEVDRHGTRYYHNAAGQLHREGGPAIEYKDGSKSWYRNGELHREDGPAIDHVDGTNWYVNGLPFHWSRIPDTDQK